jgi:peptidoglycan/LPS O-acetylase OafA/YrhL
VTPHASPSSGRIPGLDGLRAIAVLLVIVVHFCPAGPVDTFYGSLVRSGHFGVEIFFVLSGFLITHLLIREEVSAGRIGLLAFYLRRALRILPPVLLYLGFLFVARLIGWITVPDEDLIAGAFFYRNIVGHDPLCGHLWSLAIEEQYYLLWPVLLLLVSSMRCRIALVGFLVVLSPVWRTWALLSAGDGSFFDVHRTDLRMEPLLIGSLLALALSTSTGRRILTKPLFCGSWLAILATVLTAILLLMNGYDQPTLRSFGPSFSWWCIAIVINSTIHDPHAWHTKLLEWKPLKWLGTLSFSLYIWQQFFAPVVGSPTTWYRSFPLNVVFSMLCAIVSYYAVEKPFLALRAKLANRGVVT